MFQDVHVMIFVGFGFLMTFLKKYGYSSVGLNFVVSALVIQWSILSNSFWHQLLGMKSWHKVELVIETLITADFAAGAVLITFGAVLGKVTPAQLMIIALIEVSVYGINESIGAGKFGAVDMGGSIFVHTFGAYFGLACSLGLGLAFTRNDSIGDLSKPTLCCATARRSEIDKKMEDANKENEATKTSDMMAMIGTLFLWMFWPSFNGALATESQQHRVVINTLLSLCACCVSAFMFSALLRGLAQQISNGDSSHYKFDMVDIQNATLAGGVAVGSSADLVIEPWGAIVIGIIAGFVSVAGYVFVQPFLQRAIGLHDTCGVHNLHGMPGILGGIAGMISAMTAGEEKYGQSISTVFPERANGRTAAQQGGYQIAALVLTMAMACSGNDTYLHI
jgi:ammonium transporter Rh